MKFTGAISAIIVSACLVSAAPVEDAIKRANNNPLDQFAATGPGQAAEEAVASLFGGGDEFLNGPGDAARNPKDAAANAMKYLNGVGSAANKIGKDIMGNGKSN